MTLFDITTAYGTFAQGGVVTEPYTVLEIRRPNGDVIYSRAKDPQEHVQGVPEETIAELNHMMNAVVESGTGRRAFLGFTPQAGKTGTNQSYRDAWFIGYTAHYVGGVWIGNDDGTRMLTLSRITLHRLSAATSSNGRNGLVSRLPRLRDHISSMKVVENPIFERNRISHSSTAPISTPAACANGLVLPARYFCRKPQVSICRKGQ